MVEKYIDEEVWECVLKYIRMMRKTKEKYFESLLEGKPVEQYAKELKDLWTMDHRFMDDAIKDLEEMIKDKDIKVAKKYGDEKIVQRSIKLENQWQKYNNIDYEIYKLNPERDFTIMEQRYVNRHIKYYESTQKGLGLAQDKETYLSKIVKKYDKIDKSIPYFAHKDTYRNGKLIYKAGQIINYQTIATYNSMLYNVNLTRSAWNRTNYDGEILGNNLQYLVAHPYSCPKCMFYQGKVYTTDPNDKRYPQKEEAIEGGVGHPNCKHTWTLFWSNEQIQRDKFNSAEWEDKYKNEQKIRSLDLEKSRLLSDRRIYNSLGQQDKVDECSSNIKNIRAKMKELKDQA